MIEDKDLPRKYEKELHSNELILLAYYIAAVNIEEAFHSRTKEYKTFAGMVLTDTFQSAEQHTEGNKDMFAKLFPFNSARLTRQLKTPIQVIIGNPPYSAGQKDANDNNANLAYPRLDERIRASYTEFSTATNKVGLYDSYIRAIRWASDRIHDQGIIAFVSNGGYIDGKAMDGLRHCLHKEFSRIYCFNLRGNTRAHNWRTEGGKVFGQGSRATIAVTFLIKNPRAQGECTIDYHDIGDYLSREEKLEKIKNYASVTTIKWQRIKPNKYDDWINQRDPAFATYLPYRRQKEQK